MDGVGGTVKNVVFQEVKSGRLSIGSPKEFAEAADRLVAVDSLYLPESRMMEEPAEVSEAPKISDTLKVHKVKRKVNSNNITYLEFFQLSSDIQPFYSQFYRKTDDPAVCWHTSADDIDENTCGYCSGKYGDNEQEWMECPSCKKWYHEKCFSL